MPLSAEQHLIRRTGIGASEVADVVGIGDYADPFRVYLRKVSPELCDNTPTLTMRRGDALEGLTLDAYEEKFSCKVTRNLGTIRHARFDWALASLDGIDGDIAVEAKAPGSRAEFEWARGNYPEHYYCQAQWQMEVSGLRRAHLIAIIDDDLEVRIIDFDPEVAEVLLDQVRWFWERHVVSRVPPPRDTSRVVQDYLKRKFPQNNGALRPATDDERELAGKLASVKRQIKSLEQEHETLQHALCERIGEHDGLEGDGWKCTWKRASPSLSVDYPGLVRELAVPVATLDRFTKQKPGSRRFLLSMKGDQ